MQLLLRFFTLLLSVSLSAQAPNSLRGNTLFETTDSTYIRIDRSQLTPEHKVIRRLSNNQVIALTKEGKSGSILSDNSGINHNWKWQSTAADERLYYIRTSQSLRYVADIQEIWFDSNRSLALISAHPKAINAHLLPLPAVTFIQPAGRVAQTESLLRIHNLGINGIKKTHRDQPGLSAASLIVSVKEDALDTTDLDLAGRASLDGLTSDLVVSHATNMATLIGGAANTGKAGEGVARSVRFLSEDFENLLPAADQAFVNRNITLQNHSYGVGIENFYGVESAAFDQQAFTLPTLLHVFSSGNLGSFNSTGDYADIVRYRTLTGSFKQAKNVLVVTGSDDEANIPEAHSAGPAYDGRIKPELTAFGGGGTSDAAALVSGAGLLIQEQFAALYGGFATIDLLKGILIASSKEIGAAGPDFLSGYGQLSLPRALQLVDEGTFIQDTLLGAADVAQGTIDIPSGAHELKVVLSWIDPPANDGDAFALVHDLDLNLTKDGTNWQPWVLDPRPNVDVLSAQATTGIDTLNNIEMITITAPEAGRYTWTLSSHELSDDQAFSVTYFVTNRNQFEWTYPTRLDAFTTGETQMLYFDNTFTNEGTIEISALNREWQNIGTISPGNQLFSFLPENSGEVVLRAVFADLEFRSDTFAIHPKIDLQVNLLCDEEMSLRWNEVGADRYQLSMFDGEQLTSIAYVAGQDTLIDRSQYSGVHFSVTPFFSNVSGLSDETLNITQQGAGCYLNNFLVTLNEEGVVELNLALSLAEQIASANIFRIDNNGVTVLLDIDPDQSVYAIEDPSPVPGRTRYQARILTDSGLEILSAEIEIFTTDDTQYILFPNPVSDGQLTLLSPTTNAIFQVIDANARIVSNYLISAEAETFSVDGLDGVYYYRVIKDEEVVKTGRFVLKR